MAVAAIIDGNPSGAVECYSAYMVRHGPSGCSNNKFMSSIQMREPRVDGLNQLTFPYTGLSEDAHQ